MPTGALTPEAMELLRQPNPAVMATVRSDGQPVSVATWYLVEDDGRILLNLDSERVRVKHLKNDGRVALTALKDGEWYTHLSVQGHVVEVVDDPQLVDIDRLAQHYTGQPYPTRDRARVSVRVQIDRWHGWGELAD
ncbi:PPOX class F420-dependent oxidoreductase [Naumannella sp. ID2617S]|uniref:PPOX class F420-dependent enzyme n=1 Tax=Enemella dayhoffiae TaxID=2016507 RepID=A0A255GS51_9ACTN|nr:PPOX class F420-dependent oxidoreductase [Enemella dayhoffiae]NNG20648.1 PPOX class F420-dependent oxidoreductase [Naumannella sp. ID2617S]OYO18628.1 PPOX class F420-dependent enzyme [Enemella dayhoffiae]